MSFLHCSSFSQRYLDRVVNALNPPHLVSIRSPYIIILEWEKGFQRNMRTSGLALPLVRRQIIDLFVVVVAVKCVTSIRQPQA